MYVHKKDRFVNSRYYIVIIILVFSYDLVNSKNIFSTLHLNR